MYKLGLVLPLQDFDPKIYLSESDFASITANGSLCNKYGRLGQTEFVQLMRTQVVFKIE